MSIIEYLIAIIIFLSLFSSTSNASEKSSSPSCQIIYGGGESCTQSKNITINKKIQNPQTLEFIENLNLDNYKYYPGQIVKFNIQISNTTNNQINYIIVKDIFPKDITCFSTNSGKCSNDKKTATFTIEKLNSKESKTLLLSGKIKSQDEIINNQKKMCFINQAIAIQNNQKSQDNCQICINNFQTNQASPTAKPPLNNSRFHTFPPSSSIKTSPKTGPENITILSLILAGVIGSFIRKKPIN